MIENSRPSQVSKGWSSRNQASYDPQSPFGTGRQRCIQLPIRTRPVLASAEPGGLVIGLETDDDVSVSGNGSSELLEQDKHSIRDGAVAFGDRSRDLWNTLAIWVEALDTKEVARTRLD